MYTWKKKCFSEGLIRIWLTIAEVFVNTAETYSGNQLFKKMLFPIFIKKKVKEWRTLLVNEEVDFCWMLLSEVN
jgi:hypothetical protein